MKVKNEKIDFVILWVDGNDPEWRKEKNKYSNNSNKDVDSRDIRYRDWDNLKYWFRGIEKFTPWVNKIHFVTWGHLPSWLNVKHPKLNIVKHSDFIPSEYLPTFSANAIENNIFRIKDLSSNFVYFNDDFFVVKPMKETDFFINNTPRDAAFLNAIISYRENNTHIEAANMDIINDHFNKSEVLKKNFTKWFNFRYGTEMIRTICLLPWKAFPGIKNAHLPNSFKKETFETVWKKEFDVLDATCKRKFRYALDVNQWLFEDWQIVTGKFVPRSPKIGKSVALGNNQEENQQIYDMIRKQKYKIICVNDMVTSDIFEEEKKKLQDAFESILPDKSSFEK